MYKKLTKSLSVLFTLTLFSPYYSNADTYSVHEFIISHVPIVTNLSSAECAQLETTFNALVHEFETTYKHHDHFHQKPDISELLKSFKEQHQEAFSDINTLLEQAANQDKGWFFTQKNFWVVFGITIGILFIGDVMIQCSSAFKNHKYYEIADDNGFFRIRNIIHDIPINSLSFNRAHLHTTLTTLGKITTMCLSNEIFLNTLASLILALTAEVKIFNLPSFARNTSWTIWALYVGFLLQLYVYPYIKKWSVEKAIRLKPGIVFLIVCGLIYHIIMDRYHCKKIINEQAQRALDFIRSYYEQYIDKLETSHE